MKNTIYNLTIRVDMGKPDYVFLPVNFTREDVLNLCQRPPNPERIRNGLNALVQRAFSEYIRENGNAVMYVSNFSLGEFGLKVLDLANKLGMLG